MSIFHRDSSTIFTWKKNLQAATTQLLGHGRAVPMEPFGVVLGSLNTNKMIDRFCEYAANMDEILWNYDMIWLLIRCFCSSTYYAYIHKLHPTLLLRFEWWLAFWRCFPMAPTMGIVNLCRMMRWGKCCSRTGYDGIRPPSWELTYPLPKVRLKLIFLSQVGYVIVPWRGPFHQLSIHSDSTASKRQSQTYVCPLVYISCFLPRGRLRLIVWYWLLLMHIANLLLQCIYIYRSTPTDIHNWSYLYTYGHPQGCLHGGPGAL